MVLNALKRDPLLTWKGPWRWYHEDMLDCCRPLEKIKEEGIPWSEFVCLAQCHGLDIEAKRAAKNPQNDTSQDRGPSVHTLEGSVEAVSPDVSVSSDLPACCQRISLQKQSARVPQVHSLEDFRNDVKHACSTVELPIVIVSYSRKELLQTGDGHFSPVAGYHRASDQALILDTARFKYPPHWVPLHKLYAAMQRVDASTGERRGWVLVTGVAAEGGTRCKDAVGCRGASQPPSCVGPCNAKDGGGTGGAGGSGGAALFRPQGDVLSEFLQS